MRMPVRLSRTLNRTLFQSTATLWQMQLSFTNSMPMNTAVHTSILSRWMHKRLLYLCLMHLTSCRQTVSTSVPIQAMVLTSATGRMSSKKISQTKVCDITRGAKTYKGLTTPSLAKVQLLFPCPTYLIPCVAFLLR